MKLYFVSGVRHSAVVLAESEKEAIELAVKVSNGKEDNRVLHGYVGDWESPEAQELILPKGFKIVSI